MARAAAMTPTAGVRGPGPAPEAVPPAAFRGVGAPVPRKEDRRMLLGRGRFTGDLARTGTLHAAFVRSPFAAAQVKAIDLSGARARPGVRPAFTPAELGPPSLPPVLEREEFPATRMPLLA